MYKNSRAMLVFSAVLAAGIQRRGFDSQMRGFDFWKQL